MSAGVGKKPHVLVLEDEALIAMLIEEHLNELGYIVVGPVQTVEQGIASLEGEGIDAALLDVNLGGGKTSFPFAQELARRGVPFAFLTGYGKAGLQNRFAKAPTLTKPVDEAALSRTLSALLAGGSS